jgi:hypothetical protein
MVVPSCPNYCASSFGRIMRIASARNCGPFNIILEPKKPSPNGYFMVSLWADGKSDVRPVGAFVCEAFHGPRPSRRHQAAHGDGNSLNNREGNLRWATPAENMADCIAHGTMPRGDNHYTRLSPEKTARGSINGRSKLTEGDVRKIALDTRIHREIALDFGVTRSCISMIKRGEYWKHVV